MLITNGIRSSFLVLFSTSNRSVSSFLTTTTAATSRRKTTRAACAYSSSSSSCHHYHHLYPSSIIPTSALSVRFPESLLFGSRTVVASRRSPSALSLFRRLRDRRAKFTTTATTNQPTTTSSTTTMTTNTDTTQPRSLQTSLRNRRRALRVHRTTPTNSTPRSILWYTFRCGDGIPFPSMDCLALGGSHDDCCCCWWWWWWCCWYDDARGGEGAGAGCSRSTTTSGSVLHGGYRG